MSEVITNDNERGVRLFVFFRKDVIGYGTAYCQPLPHIR